MNLEYAEAPVLEEASQAARRKIEQVRVVHEGAAPDALSRVAQIRNLDQQQARRHQVVAEGAESPHRVDQVLEYLRCRDQLEALVYEPWIIDEALKHRDVVRGTNVFGQGAAQLQPRDLEPGLASGQDQPPRPAAEIEEA